MIQYRFLSPTELPRVVPKLLRWIPDRYRNVGTLNGVTLFEVGILGAIFWLSDIVVGWRANVHVVILDRTLLGKATEAARVCVDLMRLYQLHRLEACVPTMNVLACRYAERVGFALEGVLRKAEIWNNEVTDLAIYALLKEDVHG